MRLVQRWWNGRFNRLARRDIWPERNEVWQVRVRQGAGDSTVTTWTFPSPEQADAMVKNLRDFDGDGWKDITQASADRFKHRPQRGARPAQTRPIAIRYVSVNPHKQPSNPGLGRTQRERPPGAFLQFTGRTQVAWWIQDHPGQPSILPAPMLVKDHTPYTTNSQARVRLAGADLRSRATP